MELLIALIAFSAGFVVGRFERQRVQSAAAPASKKASERPAPEKPLDREEQWQNMLRFDGWGDRK